MKHTKLHILISRPAQILMVGLIMLLAIAVADAIILGIAEIVSRWYEEPITSGTAAPVEKELTAEEKKQQRIERSQIKFLPDGSIHLVYTPVPPLGIPRWELPQPETTMQQVYDTNDNLLWEGQRENNPYTYIFWPNDEFYDRRLQGIYTNNSQFDSRRLRGIQFITPELSETLEIRLETQQGRLEFWRYDPARDYLVGYEARGPKIGYISAVGFTFSKTEAQPFGKFGALSDFTQRNPFRPAVLWQTDSRLYKIDLQTRQVEIIFESPEISIDRFTTRMCIHPDSSMPLPPELFDVNCRPFIDCITQNRTHHLMLLEPQKLINIVLPVEWANWHQRKMEITVTRSGIFLYRAWTEIKPSPDRKFRKKVEQWYNEYRRTHRKIWDELYKINEDGSLRLLSSFSRTKPSRELPEPVEPPVTIFNYAQNVVKAFSTPLYTVVWNVFGDELMNEFSDTSNLLLATIALITRGLHADKITPNITLSALMVVIALWHGWARRASWVKLILWLIIVGAFNLAGLLTYLALNHTPVIKCPICGKKRGLETLGCIRCGNPLPTPQRRPTDLILAT